MTPGERDVLLIVDVQNDFIPGGALAVAHGDEVVPLVSFASSHAGKKPFETIELPYGPQVLWPDHCVQGTPGADFHRGLEAPHAELIIRKGYRRQVDSYSAFCEVDGKTSTGLAGYLRDRGLEHVFLAGLDTDFCVAWSALDARTRGFRATAIEDACRAIDTGGSLAKAWRDMAAAGVARLASPAVQP